jgi:catechol 2,3-dioxygenase-like lactoylglutathione lyase family enzyme
MKQSLGLVALVVREYDEALAFFVDILGFQLIEDTFIPEQSKRWVVVSPPGATESRLLLTRASTSEQQAHIGVQTGGRVFLFLYTDDFWRDYEAYRAKGVVFIREPKEEPYGIPHSANERFLQVEPESRSVWEHLRSRFNLGKRDEERNARWHCSGILGSVR